MSNDQELFPMSCCDGKKAHPKPKGIAAADPPAGGFPWQTGFVLSAAGAVPRVSTRLDRQDLFGSWKVRWSIGRMTYQVPPGLYAAGHPGPGSPVVVTANYKLSFDHLRRELSGLDLWLVVLDTKGINVWCAAGKGTFGTAEIVGRIAETQLPRVVEHRTIILPQLGAPGVAAHEVRRQTGFKVIYGPVRAADLPAFLKAGRQAAPEMRRTRFRLADRLVLAPVELAALLKPALGTLVVLFMLNLMGVIFKRAELSAAPLVGQTLTDFIPILGAAFAGAVLTPALLPYLPGRAFAWKGMLLGALWTLAYVLWVAPGAGWLELAAYFLLLPAIAAFLAMNFTGSSTYTSLSGVLKEMSVALPAVIITAILGAAGLVTAYFL